MFREATNKRGLLIIEGIQVCFITTVGRALAGNNRCAGITIERSYHYSGLYFFDAV